MCELVATVSLELASDALEAAGLTQRAVVEVLAALGGAPGSAGERVPLSWLTRQATTSPESEYDHKRQMSIAKGFDKTDRDYFSSLLAGAIRESGHLEHLLEPYLDRKIAQLSPVERAILLLAAYEMHSHPDVPYRVVINEAVELAKNYGGTDGFKYVNGVLDKLAADQRPAETARR